MLRILTEEERRRIREAFAEHPLYVACDVTFPRRRGRLEGLVIEVEDVFCAAAHLLDTLYNAEEEQTQEDIDALWDKLLNDIRDADSKASEHDKRQVAHTVFAIVRKVLCHHYETWLRDNLFDMLGDTIEREMENADKKEMEYFIGRLIDKTNALQRWVNQEYDGELSEEVEKCLGKEENGGRQNTPKQGKKEKVLMVAEGMHPAFPFIDKNGDPYRLAQVIDLYSAMTKSKKEGGLELIEVDLKDFIRCFKVGNTKAFILWMGSIRQLHYIIYEWKNKGYIPFENGDSAWMIASKVFANPEKKVNGRPTFFDATELRTTRNPETITEDLEAIVEILNPDNPSPHYERFKLAAENRIGYGQKKRASKRIQQKADAAAVDIFEHVFDDYEE